MQVTTNLANAGTTMFERALGAARYQMEAVGQHYLNRYAGAELDERLFRHLLSLSRLASQYGNILEELNDPHFDFNLSEFRGDF
ncbi:MAG: hypothetical protein R3183_11365 [Oleiphilaceae bacterium]|nr:hypothetical protein [Oleiphilaceae bacterium]